MSTDADTKQDIAWPEDLTTDNVLAYLKAHPDLLAQNPQVLDHLQVPGRQHGGGVVDFQQAMLTRLKDANSQARELHKDLVETARANLNNQSRIHTAVLILLEATSFEEFIQTVTQDLCVILNVDVATLVIESNGQDIPHVHQSGVRVVPPGTVEMMLGNTDAILQGNIRGSEDIYGPQAAAVHSEALLRLEVSSTTPLGILAFGSNNPDTFHEEQAIDQVTFLAQVVERCIRIWLDLPS